MHAGNVNPNPKPAWRPRVPSANEFNYNDQSGIMVYTVKPGDTLSGILQAARLRAKKDGFALDGDANLQMIAQYNNISNINLIVPGQQIVIPAEIQLDEMVISKADLEANPPSPEDIAAVAAEDAQYGPTDPSIKLAKND